MELPRATDYLVTPEGAPSRLVDLAGAMVGNQRALDAVRTNWRTADPAFLDKAKAALVTDCSDEEFVAMLNGLLPDESLTAPSTPAPVDPLRGAESRARTSGTRTTSVFRSPCRTG